MEDNVASRLVEIVGILPLPWSLLAVACLILFMGVLGWGIVVLLDRQRRFQDSIIERLTHLDANMEVLNAQATVFWKEAVSNAARILHSPHTPTLDGLMAQHEAGTLDASGHTMLCHLLSEVVATTTESPFRRGVALGLLHEVQAAAPPAQR